MYHNHLGEAVQQHMTTQPQQQIVGSKRPLSEESDNSENINVQTAPKRFHPMDPKSGDSPTRESGEDGVDESADEEEEEDESNGSSDAEATHQPMNATNFGYTAGPPVHAIANPSMGSSAMAQPPYQFQNMAQNFFGRAVTSQHQQFPYFEFPNAYQMRPLCIDKKTITNADQSTILRNLQNLYCNPSLFSSPHGSHLQQQQQPHNYGPVQAKSMEGAPNSQMMAQRPLISFGPISSTHPTQYVASPSPFALQQLSGNGTRTNALTTYVPQGTPPVERSDISINNDSGLGLTDRSGKDSKNESSSTDDTANFVREEFGTQQNSAANKFVQFVPFVRSVSIDGTQQYCDLEQIVYSETPARLTLLGNMTKYPITLAEIVRRVSPPECLNTSFLSGILRRAKNKDGGKRFRMELQRFNCGVDLQTGRRKTGAITTFTALCERESIKLAKDFDKLVKDEHNGFPDKELATELIRKAALNSLKEPNCTQLLGNFQNASNILRDAIQLLEGAIEQETGEFVSPVAATDLVIQQQQQQANAIDDLELMNRFKRFARLSHCFGNRGMLCAWQILLSVFTNCESDLQRMSNSNYPSVELKQRKQPTMALPAEFTAADLSTLQAQGSSSWMS